MVGPPLGGAGVSRAVVVRKRSPATPPEQEMENDCSLNGCASARRVLRRHRPSCGRQLSVIRPDAAIFRDKHSHSGNSGFPFLFTLAVSTSFWISIPRFFFVGDSFVFCFFLPFYLSPSLNLTVNICTTLSLTFLDHP